MQLGRNSKKAASIFCALALCVTSTGAIAAPTSPQAPLSPFVALSALGSGASAAALCGSPAAASAGARGCATSAINPAMAAAAVQAAPAYDSGYADGGSNVSPLLLAVAGVAVAVALYYLVFRGNDNFHIDFPEFPTSPA